MKSQKSAELLPKFENKPGLEIFTGYYFLLCFTPLIFRALGPSDCVTLLLHPYFSTVLPAWSWC